MITYVTALTQLNGNDVGRNYMSLPTHTATGQGENEDSTQEELQLKTSSKT